MSDGTAYADIIILALIAGFILLRLRSVLGQNDEQNPPNFLHKQQEQKMRQDAESVIQLLDKNLKSKKLEPEEADPAQKLLARSSDEKTIKDISAKNPEFTLSSFVSGAKLAFEMVFDAFAKGDKATLKMLLSSELYDHFCESLEKRSDGDSKETTLLFAEARRILSVSLDKNIVRIEVEFVSEQVSVTRNKDGVIVEGDPSRAVEVVDDWVFERDITSKNPNWTIIET